MKELFVKRKLITQYEIDQLMFYWHDDIMFRDTRQPIIKNEYPEFLEDFRNRCVQYMNEYNGEQYKIHTERGWIYAKGAKFEKHHDRNFPNREITCLTLIHKSNDLDGGQFLVYDHQQDEGIDSELEVGETIFFDSGSYHEVLPILKGWRGSYGICLGLANFVGSDQHKL